MNHIKRLLMVSLLILFGSGCATGIQGTSSSDIGGGGEIPTSPTAGGVIITFDDSGLVTFKGVPPVIVGSEGVLLVINDNDGNPVSADELIFEIGYVEEDGSCNTTSGEDLGSMNGLQYVPPENLPNNKMARVCILAYFVEEASINLKADVDAAAGRTDIQLRLDAVTHVYRLAYSDTYSAYELWHASMFSRSDNSLYFCWSNISLAGTQSINCIANEEISDPNQPLKFGDTSITTVFSESDGNSQLSDSKVMVDYDTDQPMLFASKLQGVGLPLLLWDNSSESLVGLDPVNAAYGRPAQSGEGSFNSVGSLASAYSQEDEAWAVCYEATNGGIYCSVTSDGESYSTPVHVSENFQYESKPDVVYKDGKIYVVWHYNYTGFWNVGDVTRAIYFARSDDNGMSYSSVVPAEEVIYQGPSSVASGTPMTGLRYNAKIAVSSDGTGVHILYYTDSSISGGDDYNTIRYLRSTDGGDTFEGSVRFDRNQLGITEGVRINTHKIYIDPYDRIHVVWRQSLGGSSLDDTLMYRYSLDGGESFSDLIDIGVGDSSAYAMISDLAGRLYVGVASFVGDGLLWTDFNAHAQIFVITQEELTYELPGGIGGPVAIEEFGEQVEPGGGGDRG